MSTILATAVSDWPTPTVSTRITSYPAASSNTMVSRVAFATPPSVPEVGDGRMNAFGSTGNGSFTPNDGGAGTVYVDDTNDASPNGSLTIDNNNLAAAANTIQTCLPDCAQTYDNITIRNAAEYEIPTGMSLTLASGVTPSAT